MKPHNIRVSFEQALRHNEQMQKLFPPTRQQIALKQSRGINVAFEL